MAKSYKIYNMTRKVEHDVPLLNPEAERKRQESIRKAEEQREVERLAARKLLKALKEGESKQL